METAAAAGSRRDHEASFVFPSPAVVVTVPRSSLGSVSHGLESNRPSWFFFPFFLFFFREKQKLHLRREGHPCSESNGRLRLSAGEMLRLSFPVPQVPVEQVWIGVQAEQKVAIRECRVRRHLQFIHEEPIYRRQYYAEMTSLIPQLSLLL